MPKGERDKEPSTSTIRNFPIFFEDLPKKKDNSGNSRKYLTKDKKNHIMGSVIKLKRKDDKMTKEKNTKNNKRDILKSITWLLEATFRIFVGWLLLSNFDNIFVVIAALYALGSAGVIVIAHFVKAYTK